MFRVHDANVADTEVLMYLPPKELEAIEMGEALTYSDQGLTKCAATDRPQYICRGIKTADGLIPVAPRLGDDKRADFGADHNGDGV